MTSTDIAADMQAALNDASPVREYFGGVASTLAEAAGELDSVGRRDLSARVDEALGKIVDIAKD